MIYINGVALPEQPAELDESPNLIYSDQNSVTGYKERITYGARKKVTMSWTYIKPATQQLLMNLFAAGEPVTYLNDDSKLYGGANEFIGIITPSPSAYIRGGTGYIPFSVTIEEGYVYGTVGVSSNMGTDFLIANTIIRPLKSVQLYGDTTQDGTPAPASPVPIFTVTGEQSIVMTDGGSNSQSFTIDLGNNELCKIGEYQDYIYRSSGGWAINKSITYNILTGDSIEDWDSTTQDGGFYRFNLNNANILSFGDDYRHTGRIISDRFQPSTVAAVGTVYQYHTLAVFYPPTGITTVAELRSWLSANNTGIYVVATTPISVPITDTNLIAQLDQIANASVYKGVTTFSVSGTLPAILGVEAYTMSGGSQ